MSFILDEATVKAAWKAFYDNICSCEDVMHEDMPTASDRKRCWAAYWSKCIGREAWIGWDRPLHDDLSPEQGLAISLLHAKECVDNPGAEVRVERGADGIIEVEIVRRRAYGLQTLRSRKVLTSTGKLIVKEDLPIEKVDENMLAVAKANEFRKSVESAARIADKEYAETQEFKALCKATYDLVNLMLKHVPNLPST